MKIFFKPILKYYLKFITKAVLFVYRPTVVAVSGSINKSFFKDEIKRVLRSEGIATRSNGKSFNTEIGLPLAILDLGSGYNSFKKWLPVMHDALTSIFKNKFSRVLVLELGVSSPGDMKYLLSLVRPKISVITDITQRYLESFSDMDDLSQEYEFLAKNTAKNGLVILNHDNIRLRGMAKKTRTKVETFGFSEGSDWRISEIERKSDGQLFKIKHKDLEKEYAIERFGQHHVLARAVGEIIKDNLKIINNK